MTVKNVYCPIDDISTFCSVVCEDFSDDMALVKADTSDYVVEKKVMFDTQAQCDEYIKSHCELIAAKTLSQVETLPDLLAYLLASEMRHNENRMEVATLISAASVYTQIDMYEYLREYLKHQEKSTK